MESKTVLDQLSIDQKIGQLLIFGWDGDTVEEKTTVSEHARTLLDEFQVGGIILLGRNVGTPERTANTMNEMQQRSRIPLFIIADQEGGMVCRFKDPFVVFPSNMALGATGKVDLAYRAAKATAQQLRAVGVNFDFAPCVDVNNNLKNPIIGTRSYGDNASTVGRFAAEAIRGFHDGGVLTSAKHFPGHGDTSVDSHLALPVVEFGRERIDTVELAPFKSAIEAGVASIMTTHIVFTVLDPDLPATISPAIITGLLRAELGWEGLVITDCLEMKGVATRWGTPEAAVMAVRAGVDCPLICHTLSVQREAFKQLKNAVADGEISERRLNESVSRVLMAKEKLGILATASPAQPQAALEIVSDKSKQDLALEIARQAVTIARNEDRVLPAKLQPDDLLLIVSLHSTLEAFADEFRKIHRNVTAVSPGGDRQGGEGDFGAAIYPGVVTGQPRSVSIDEFPEIDESVKLIVAATCPSEPWTKGMDEAAQARLVQYLYDSGLPLVVVSLREPYDIVRFPEIKSYVCLYGYRREQLQAAAEVILGMTRAEGRLPVQFC